MWTAKLFALFALKVTVILASNNSTAGNNDLSQVNEVVPATALVASSITGANKQDETRSLRYGGTAVAEASDERGLEVPLRTFLENLSSYVKTFANGLETQSGQVAMGSASHINTNRGPKELDRVEGMGDGLIPSSSSQKRKSSSTKPTLADEGPWRTKIRRIEPGIDPSIMPSIEDKLDELARSTYEWRELKKMLKTAEVPFPQKKHILAYYNKSKEDLKKRIEDKLRNGRFANKKIQAGIIQMLEDDGKAYNLHHISKMIRTGRRHMKAEMNPLSYQSAENQAMRYDAARMEKSKQMLNPSTKAEESHLRDGLYNVRAAAGIEAQEMQVKVEDLLWSVCSREKVRMKLTPAGRELSSAEAKLIEDSIDHWLAKYGGVTKSINVLFQLGLPGSSVRDIVLASRAFSSEEVGRVQMYVDKWPTSFKDKMHEKLMVWLAMYKSKESVEELLVTHLNFGENFVKDYLDGLDEGFSKDLRPMRAKWLKDQLKDFSSKFDELLNNREEHIRLLYEGWLQTDFPPSAVDATLEMKSLPQSSQAHKDFEQYVNLYNKKHSDPAVSRLEPFRN